MNALLALMLALVGGRDSAGLRAHHALPPRDASALRRFAALALVVTLAAAGLCAADTLAAVEARRAGVSL